MEGPAVGMAAEGLVKDQVQALVGKQMGSYKILSLLGKGGMGEVYRALDTQLEREVAIKVLPAEFTQDPERLARFEREAKLLAALNHPNIAAIYGLEESDGIRFLVLELVEGETLGERLVKGALPVEKALEVCRQIAEGVEAAHEKGVIHRDLKPANVKITPEGKVKILDFGLAKAFEGETSVTDISQSPTLTEEMTRAGVILGTAAYMSPEQAKGKPVDKRADIFAFGAMLYELLTGKRAFEGETITETIAKVLESEPNWDALPDTTPWTIRNLLRRCLTKDPHDRLRDIANVRIEIKMAVEEPAMASPIGVGSTAQPPLWKVAIPWSIAVLAVLLAISIAFRSSRQSTSPPLTKFVIAPALVGSTTVGGNLAVSADGGHVLYRNSTVKGYQLYLRSLDDLVERPIPGTENAVGPFFSPDGKSAAFFAGFQLKKVSLAGGSPTTLCEARGLRASGSWGSDDTIVFSGGYESGDGLFRVSASGGEPEILTTPDLDKGETGYHFPHILPGGKTVLFTISRRSANPQIAALSLETGEQKILIEDGRQPKYLNTGHFIYEQFATQSPTGNLMVVPFDLATLAVIGDPVPVLQGVRTSRSADYALSDEGTLVYIPTREESRLVWVDRDGRTQRVTEIQRNFLVPRLSPDGTRLSVTVQDEAGGSNTWIYEIARDILTPFMVEGGSSRAIWSPDGQQLIFASGQGPLNVNLFLMPIDGSAEAKQLTTGENVLLPTSWSPDGLVAYVRIIIPNADILVLSLEGEREPQTVLATQYDERNATFSPNGRWLAFTSDRSDQIEVYVKPYPGQGGIVQISTDGGLEPVWARSGKELFYRTGDQMMVVSVQADTTFKAEKPRLLFEGSYRYTLTTGVTSNYDVTADGQRFVMVKEETTQINVVLNWFEELKRLVPTN